VKALIDLNKTAKQSLGARKEWQELIDHEKVEKLDFLECIGLREYLPHTV